VHAPVSGADPAIGVGGGGGMLPTPHYKNVAPPWTVISNYINYMLHESLPSGIQYGYHAIEVFFINMRSSFFRLLILLDVFGRITLN